MKDCSAENAKKNLWKTFSNCVSELTLPSTTGMLMLYMKMPNNVRGAERKNDMMMSHTPDHSNANSKTKPARGTFCNWGARNNEASNAPAPEGHGHRVIASFAELEL